MNCRLPGRSVNASVRESTEGGRCYFAACSRVVDALRDADEEVTGEYHQPKGDLVITAPLGFGQQHLQPVVHAFLRAHAQINVHLQLDDREPSLTANVVRPLQLDDRVLPMVEEHVDCALRIGALADSGLVAREVGTIRIVVCAAPAYLQARGMPRDLSALSSHDCISWTALGRTGTWTLTQRQGATAVALQVPVHARVSTTTPDSALQAAIAGLGLLQATSYQVAPHVASGALVPVLVAHHGAPLPVSLVHPGKRLMPMRLRAWLDFAAPRLQQRLSEIEAVMQAMDGSTD